MLVEVTTGFVRPCLDLKPFNLGLSVVGALLGRVLGTAIAGSTLAGDAKIDDVPHPKA